MSEGSFSKATTTNPKDLLGNKKVSITKFPMTALIHGAHAMMNGADKYGPYNWRAKDVIASIYIDAAIRHITAWFEREQVAEDSGVHHLGHALACLAILLDAEEHNNLVDDRPNAKSSDVIKNLLDRLSEVINVQRGKQKATDVPVASPSDFILSNTVRGLSDALSKHSKTGPIPGLYRGSDAPCRHYKCRYSYQNPLGECLIEEVYGPAFHEKDLSSVSDGTGFSS